MYDLKRFSEWFSIRRGVTALIGGGGKTSLLLAIGKYLCKHGSVILCTSTHIYPPDGLSLYERLDARVPYGVCVVVGTRDEYGKITSPKQPFSELIGYADYVICEADGSRGLPLKAHASHEPVIPVESGAVLAVLGLDGIGKPIREAAHRPGLYAEILCVTEDTIVTPELAAALLRSYPRVTGFVLNKSDNVERLEFARQIAALLPLPTAITVLQPEVKILELWRNGTCLLS